jgi:putative FmdB family regulatory protein
MPRYEYECSECGVRFERVQHYNDAPVTVCPECEGKVHRLIGPVGVVFKGSGFYSTDSKKGKPSSD